MAQNLKAGEAALVTEATGKPKPKEERVKNSDHPDEMSVSRDPLRVQSSTCEGAKAGDPGADRQPALSHAMGHFNFPVRI